MEKLLEVHLTGLDPRHDIKPGPGSHLLPGPAHGDGDGPQLRSDFAMNFSLSLVWHNLSI